jgi:hypothetical protein
MRYRSFYPAYIEKKRRRKGRKRIQSMTTELRRKGEKHPGQKRTGKKPSE